VNRHFQSKTMMAPKKRSAPAKGRGGSSGGANPRNDGRITEAQHDEEVAKRVKDDGEDQNDALHEVVDGSYWVIYTHANFQVLMCSDHHDAYSEEFGEPAVSGDSINWAALAYAAMARDVSDQVGAESGDLDEAPRHRGPHSARETHRSGPRGLRRR